jgi:phosphoribosylglycinamide formyltransferase-1
MAKLKVGVLISGRGSNLQAIIDAARDPAFPAEVCVVISNIPGAQGLRRAEAAGIPALTIDHTHYAAKTDFEAAIDVALDEAGIALLCLAGFMRLLSRGFVERRAGRIINIHPSLLPEFKGLHTHQRAIDSGATETGCTVHYVTPGMDEGPSIVQKRLAILPGDTPDILADRLLPLEHAAYVEAIRIVANAIRQV